MNPIIQVEHFSKKYGDFTAVDDISFTVDEGSIFAFLGPNVPRYEQETGSLFRHLQLWRELYT